jgi:hypothetical protein
MQIDAANEIHALAVFIVVFPLDSMEAVRPAV